MPRQILLIFFYFHYSRNTFFCNFYILLSNRNCFSTCAVHFSSNPQSRYVSRLPLNHSIYFSPCFYWQQTRYNFFFCRMWYIKSYQNILLLHFPILNGRLQVPCQPSGRHSRPVYFFSGFRIYSGNVFTQGKRREWRLH